MVREVEFKIAENPGGSVEERQNRRASFRDSSPVIAFPIWGGNSTPVAEAVEKVVFESIAISMCLRMRA
jgi:hypothetical protein